MRNQTVALIGSNERRALIKRCLNEYAGIAVAGEIAGDAALGLVAGLAPDIVVLDGASAGINPLVALRTLAALGAGVRVIALAGSDSPLERRLLLECGATAVAWLEQPGSLAEALGVPEFARDANLLRWPALGRSRNRAA